ARRRGLTGAGEPYSVYEPSRCGMKPASQRLHAESDLRASQEALSERQEAEALLECQRRVLEMIGLGAPLKETLEALLVGIEAQSPEMPSSILLLDRDGLHLRHCVAPRLSTRFTQAIDGSAIGERAGSCGTAAFKREPVVVEDVTTDPLWEGYRALAVA